jgi:hypothetical protein
MKQVLLEKSESPLGEVVGWLTVVALDLEYENLGEKNSEQVLELKLWMVRKIFEIRTRISSESFLETQIQKILKILLAEANLIFDKIQDSEILTYLDQIQKIADVAREELEKLPLTGRTQPETQKAEKLDKVLLNAQGTMDGITNAVSTENIIRRRRVRRLLREKEIKRRL